MVWPMSAFGEPRSTSEPMKLRPVSMAYWLATRKFSLVPPYVRPGVVFRFPYLAWPPFWSKAFRQTTSAHPAIKSW